MLVIVENPNKNWKFSLGANITAYIGHKNILSNITVNGRVFKRKQKIQEFGPIITYIIR